MTTSKYPVVQDLTIVVVLVSRSALLSQIRVFDKQEFSVLRGEVADQNC